MAKRGQGEGTISRRPDGTWWARISLGKDENGKQKRRAFYGKTRKEVQEKLTAALNEINNDTYIEPTNMTVSQWMDIWLKEYKLMSVKPGTYSFYFSLTRNHIKPVLGTYKLKELRNDIVQKFVNGLLSKGLKSRMITGAHHVLRAAVEQAVANGLVGKNAAKTVKLPPKDKEKINVLTVEQQERFIEVAKGYDNGEVFILMLATGMRIGEALGMTWEAVDLDNAELHVNKAHVEYYDPHGDSKKLVRQQGTPKTKSSIRTIPLVPNAVQMLRGLKEKQDAHKHKIGAGYLDNGLLFCNFKGAPLWKANVHNKFKCVLRDAAVDGLHIHCLRHTFATRGLENGIELKVMQEILGHSSIALTADLYTHVLPNKKKDAIMKLNDTITI